MRHRLVRFHGAAARGTAALLIIVAAAILSIVSGCGDPFLQGGALHFDAARYDKAAEVFEQAIAKNPNDALAHLWLARCYSELDRIPEAVLEFDRAVALSRSLESDAAAFRRRYWRQQYLRGESFLREALAMPAKSQQRTDRMKQASDALDQAVLLSAEAGLTYYQLYRLHDARNEPEEARKNLDMALARAEGDGDLSAELAPVLRERGRQAILREDYREGVTDYASAVRLRPDDVDVKMDLASAHLLFAESKGTSEEDREVSYREAGRVLEEVHRLRPLEPDALYNLATVRFRMQDFASADELLHSYLALRPRDPDAYQLLAETAKALNHAGEARTADLAARVTALNRPVNDTADWARKAAERFGPASALGALFGELGAPEEIHTIKEGSKTLIEVWLYIRRGRVAAFLNGDSVGEPLRLEGKR